MPTVDSNASPRLVPAAALSRNQMLVWMAALLLSGIWQFSTLTLTPTGWQDEAQITEMGRVLLNPGTGWSAVWLPRENHPLRVFPYLGALLNESAFRVAPGYAGPRTLALLGGVIASALCLAWLRSRSTQPIMAILLSLALFLDPWFVSVYRKGRVDCWALALVLAALICLCKGRGSRVWMGTAGIAFAIAVFVWPTVLFLAPLAIIERREAGRGIHSIARHQEWTGLLLGAVAASLILALCFRPAWTELLPTARSLLQFTRGSASFSLALATIRFSPVMCLAAVVAAFDRRIRVLAIATGAVALAMVYVSFYEARAVYLLPYLLELIAAGNDTRYARVASAMRAACIAIVVFGAGMNLVVRPALAYSQVEVRDVRQLTEAANAIPPGAAVYLGTWDFYYAGRVAGWRMNREYIGLLDPELLRRSNFAIFHAQDVDPETVRALGETGLHPSMTLVRNTTPAHTAPGRAYGPYIVFTRR
jgi:hypothetical protein